MRHFLMNFLYKPSILKRKTNLSFLLFKKATKGKVGTA